MKSARGLVTCVPGDEDGTSAFYMSPAFFSHDSLNDEFPPPSGARRVSSLKVPPESSACEMPVPGAKNCCHCGSMRREGDTVVTGPFSLLNVSDSFFCAKKRKKEGNLFLRIQNDKLSQWSSAATKREEGRG